MNPTADYFVEMKFTPPGVLPTPSEAVAFTERLVLPTLEACERLATSGTILAGGPLLAAAGFAFIVRAESAQQLEEMVATLPLWSRAQTTVTPLSSFSERQSIVRRRLTALKATAAAGPSSN